MRHDNRSPRLLARGCSAILAAAAGISTAAEPPRAAELEEVVVTGSNIRRARDEIDRLAIPVETVTAEQFQSSAGESIADFLQAKPIFSGRNGTPTNDYYGGGGSTLNLRGLGEAYTLVLINGRRSAGEDGITDVGAIPDEAIESVEILKSGSSAIYGANAVGGVVNIKLKRDFEGVDFAASYGNASGHDARFVRTAMMFGTSGDRYRLVGSIAWEDRNGTRKSDRALTASSDWTELGGLDARPSWAFFPQSIEGVDDPDNFYYALDGSLYGPGDSPLDASAFVPASMDQSFDMYEPDVYPPYDRVGGHWSLEYDLVDERLVLFADGYADRRRQVFEPIDLPLIGSDAFTPLLVPAANPYNPFGYDVWVTYVVGPNESSKPVESRYQTDTLQATFGAQGDFGAFGYEVAYSRFDRELENTWLNDFDAALSQAAVERTDATALNPFGYWANSPALIDSLRAPPRTTTSESIMETYSARLTASPFELPAGALGIAVGFEHRDIRYAVVNDELKETISTYWDGAATDEGRFTRGVDAWFGEAVVPVFAAPGAGFSSVELSGALRYEEYDDFESVTIPQGAVRFGFFGDTLTLRASYAEGFRAPTLDELTPFPFIYADSGVYDPYFDDFVDVNVMRGGNPDLEAEVGVTRNVGLVYAPAPNFSLRLDYWRVELEDTIESPDPAAILRGEQPGTITRDPETGMATVDARLANTGDRVIEGYDVGAYYRTDEHGFGSLAFDLSVSYLIEASHTFGEVTVQGAGLYTDVFGGMPRYRSQLSVGWDRGPWEATTFLHYEPGVDEHIPVDRKTDSYATMDLQVSYTFEDGGGWLQGLRGYAGVENLWDEDPSFFASTYIGWENSLHDFRGRYYYMGVDKKF